MKSKTVGALCHIPSSVAMFYNQKHISHCLTVHVCFTVQRIVNTASVRTPLKYHCWLEEVKEINSFHLINTPEIIKE